MTPREIMSEQEKNANVSDAGGTVVLVEQTRGSHQKTPYRPNELPDDTERHHKRTTVPAASSVAEQLKHRPEGSIVKEIAETKDIKDSERAMTSDKLKHNQVKKMSSNMKGKDSVLESIALTPIETTIKKDSVLQPAHPIPVEVQPAISTISDVVEKQEEKSNEEDSITQEVAEMKVVAHSEWSDDEEASGLPRSESRSSRVSRAVRQFFCCGVSYEAPTEYNIPSRRQHYSHGI